MDRWYWIELIGFDNELADYGVDSFLSRNVSTTGVSLLFSHVDFLFAEGETLSPTACSYGAHEYNSERRRQEWTVTQLRGLVRTLQARGVKVFFSVFDLTKDITDPAWLCYRKNGRAGKVVYPIKGLGDRTVGDEIIDGVCRAIDTYGFDGFQLADGLSSNRYSIENGDFSLSLCADSGLDLSAELMAEGEEAYVKRREWILTHHRLAWTGFIADRWAAFYDRLFERIKKPILFNQAWTRDSFETLYRYGLDYRRCHVDEAMAIMVEENSATRAITSAEDEGGVEYPLSHRAGFPYEYALMQQNIRLVTGGLPQISLMPIADTMEQWDALRHCPTELMRAIVRRYHNFVFRNGGFEVCADAPLYCLSDGISASDWQWLASVEGYRTPLPHRIEGFAAVCNPDALDCELAHFCRHRHYYGSALLHALTLGGMNLGAQLHLAEVDSFTGARCLVVTDLHAYTEEQKRRLAQARLPILAVGEDVELPLTCNARYNGSYISVALYGAEGVALCLDFLCETDRVIEADPPAHGEIWTEPLSYRRMDDRFFARLCHALNAAFALDVSEDPAVKIVSFSSGTEKYLMLSNDEYTYRLCTVRTPSAIKSAKALMKQQGYRVTVTDNAFTVRIPPRCIELVRLET